MCRQSYACSHRVSPNADPLDILRGVPLETLRESELPDEPRPEPIPGVVVVFSGGQPTLQALPVADTGLILGRDQLDYDPRLSRRHARIDRRAAGFVVSDLGSRNGTRVGGAAIAGEHHCRSGQVIQIGRTVLFASDDVTPFLTGAVEQRDGAVVGPVLARCWTDVERAARAGGGVLVTGESGAGKELAAAVFHRVAAAQGRLVSVNCAAIPAGLAERLLFGAKRGAYSGADTDSEGYVAAADKGTLFLDEIADLDLVVQGKLLRVLETGELWQLGASNPRTVSIRLVAATFKDLRNQVAIGAFREDLYYRVGRPEVRVPPLRERLEELPWLIAAAAAEGDDGLGVHASFVEACMLRPWPGNVRELWSEVRRAATVAREIGEQLHARHLGDDAGMTITPAPRELTTTSTSPAPTPLPADDVIEQALQTHEGNVTRAATALGLHRNQLRRWLTKHPEIAAAVEAQRRRSEP